MDTAAANRRIRAILEGGTVAFSKHALEELNKDVLTTVELERGTWRYRVLTNRICVVVAFRSDDEVVVVTAWRIRQR